MNSLKKQIHSTHRKKPCTAGKRYTSGSTDVRRTANAAKDRIVETEDSSIEEATGDTTYGRREPESS